MTRWIHNPEGRIIAVVRDLSEKVPPKDTSLKANGGLVLVSALVIVLGLLAIWPNDEPETLPVAAETAIENQIIAGGTGEIDGERYLALLTTSGQDLQQPALELFSASDTGELALVGRLDAPVAALDSDLSRTPAIAFTGDTLYIPLAQSRSSALWIVDVSDPETPRQLSATTLETPPGSVAVDGDLAAVGPVNGTLTRVFDVNDPAAPEPLGEYRHSLVFTGNIELVDQTLYLADRYGVSAVDVSSLDDPVEVGRYEDDDWVSRLQYYPGHVTPRIAVENEHLYAAAGSYGVNVLNVSDETDPESTTRRLEHNPGNPDPDRALNAAAFGEHLIILSQRGVATDEPLELAYVVRELDISSPGDPDVLAETEVIPSPERDFVSVAVDDSFAYFMAGSAIHSMSIAD